jgi:AcrR family transcriptional regulator
MLQPDSIAKKSAVLRISNAESNRFTRECIQTALLELLESAKLTQISISDIVNKAGVSRMAYYRNYHSKEDILENFMQDIVTALKEAMSPYLKIREMHGYWLVLFTSMQNYARQYLILLKANEGNRILEHVNQFALLISSAHTPLEKYQQYFWSGAAYNLLTEWIRNGMSQTPEEMAEICQSIFLTAGSQAGDATKTKYLRNHDNSFSQ